MTEAYLLLYLGPVLLLSLPVVAATWKRWNWSFLDLVALFLPGAVWLALVATQGGRGRSLSNLAELLVLAVLVAIMAWLKDPIQRRLPSGIARYLLVLSTSGLAVAVYYCFPGLPE